MCLYDYAKFGRRTKIESLVLRTPVWLLGWQLLWACLLSQASYDYVNVFKSCL